MAITSQQCALQSRDCSSPKTRLPADITDSPIYSVITKYDPNVAGLVAVECGLTSVFSPKTVALIGATDRPGSVGHTVLRNLMDGNRQGGHKFVVYPINPSRTSVCDMPCFKSVADCSVLIDLVVVVTPANTVLRLIEECGQAGVKAVTVISAGFKEVGNIATEQEILAVAKKHNMRIIGPNCLGVMAPHWGLNATFAATNAMPGNLAFLSQSGAMCTAVLDWSLNEHIGFSAFISVGNMCDVSWGDMIYDLGEDPNTKAILIYMETVGDVRKFLSAAKIVSSLKPILVLKAGRSAAAAAAAASHTGSLAGSHEAFMAAMKRVGVLVVESIGELFSCALFLDKQPRPRGPRLMIVTNAGGPGVLATDATALHGGEIAILEPEIVEELNNILPAAWSHANPIDVLGDASADIYSKTLRCAMKSKNCDGILVILSPQSVTEPLRTAEKLTETVREMSANANWNKPVLASWLGGSAVQAGLHHLSVNRIPAYSLPDEAAKIFCKVWSQTKNWKHLYEHVEMKTAPMTESGDIHEGIQILKQAQRNNRTILSENESKNVLKAFGIPVVETIVCNTAKETGEAAEKVMFPCVVKLHSSTITHKSDVGGVILGVKNREDAEQAFETVKTNCAKHASVEDFEGVTVQPMIELTSGVELIFGSVTDPQFGPVVVFGTGGCFVEIYKDSVSAIPPLTFSIAMSMMQQTKIWTALNGTGLPRFPGVDVTKLCQALVKFSQMICTVMPYVSELEINPMFATMNRTLALDARIVIRPESHEPPVLAVRPYPSEYVFKQPNGSTIRPIKSDDYELLREFLSRLSPESTAKRFKGQSKEDVLSPHHITHLTACDYANQICLVYIINDNTTHTDRIVGAIRFFRLSNQEQVAEVRFVVADEYQGCGVGKALMAAGSQLCVSEGIARIDGVVDKMDLRAQRVLSLDGWYESGDLSADYVRFSKIFEGEQYESALGA